MQDKAEGRKFAKRKVSLRFVGYRGNRVALIEPEAHLRPCIRAMFLQPLRHSQMLDPQPGFEPKPSLSY